jgi:signal transduction histidine kinase
MSSRAAPRLVWGMFGFTIAMLVAALILTLGGNVSWRPVVFFPATIAFAGVGGLVASRTSNKVGWLFLAFGFAMALTVVLQDYARRTGTAALPGAAWAGWIFTIELQGSLLLLSLVLLLFPDGRLPSDRWRPVAWATVVASAVAATCVAVADVNAVPFSTNFPHLSDPVTVVRATSLTGIYNGAQGVEYLIFLASAVSLVVRLIRSRGEQRLQLKWFVYASVLAAVAVTIATTVTQRPDMTFAIFVPLIPLAAGVAILKYRLYDIDVVISKTLVYGALAAFITALYVVVVVGVGSLVGSRGRPNLALSILATAVVAVAFQPVRQRVQRFANHLVYGTRATPYEALSDLSERMAGAYATEDLLPRMARTLAEATGAARTDVWLRVGNELRSDAAWPPGSEPRPAIGISGEDPPEADGVDRIVAVRHRGQLLGALSITKRRGETLTPTEDKLVADLAAQAGLVLRNVGLTEELMARLGELRASRQRLVTAQDDERRRLERNIHDGAQQQLVALAVKLRLAEQALDRDEGAAKGLLHQVRSETADALENLRDLARGIYPPLLADKGLAVALGAQAGRAPVPTTVEYGRIGRYTQEAEAAVYFCALEALNNVAKYADAARASIRLSASDGELRFEVSDDGRGFDPSDPPRGTGLQGMTDRLDAQGGSLKVRSARGAGTTISGWVPARELEAVG